MYSEPLGEASQINRTPQESSDGSKVVNNTHLFWAVVSELSQWRVHTEAQIRRIVVTTSHPITRHWQSFRTASIRSKLPSDRGSNSILRSGPQTGP